tara:strand:+ start:32 stop:517 length:486 start_codon:yes stop_codon:yes gene_type:complete
MIEVLMSGYKIINFKNEYSKFFYDLNIEWLNEFFLVEDYDKKILSNPQKYIINKGGSIFFAKNGRKIIGVVALMPTHELEVYELTKMGVIKALRNKGVGKLLLKKCIERATEKKLKKVIIYSNRILENAIYLYKSFGFTEVELEKSSNYKRADIKLELDLQ